jgi:N-acyl-D-amino-acid deacylase
VQRLILSWLVACAVSCSGENLLLKNVTLYDGSGKPPVRSDVRIAGAVIAEIGPELKQRPGEAVIDEHGLALAPGFIDMHSHADRRILEDRAAERAVRQGITTAVVGQDGGSMFPLVTFLKKLDAQPATINVASMTGQGTLREQVMGKDLFRAATPDEVARMKQLLAQEMNSGAFGLSTGLEYDAGHESTTAEIVELSRVAAKSGGFYISHVRDEGNRVFDSYDEILRIGKDASIRVEITHIKLGTTPVWHQAATRMPAYWSQAQRDGVDLKADVYPYTFWSSTIRVIVLDRDFTNPDKVAKAIAENGGAGAIRFTRYDPEPSLAGSTLEQVAAKWKMTPVEAYMKVVRETLPATHPKNTPEETVMVTSMSEDDLHYFIADPRVMYCTDGESDGKHPRGAGSFPRILGRYVREEKLLPLEEAIHKMTQMPAAQLGLADRGTIKAGNVADLVVFDPATVIDQATVEQPGLPPKGIAGVMVSGEWVVRENQVTSARPGKALRHQASLK